MSPTGDKEEVEMALRKDELKTIDKYAGLARNNDQVEKDLFAQFGVKRGLRDVNGKGVVTGITNVSRVESTEEVDGKIVPCAGKLYFRGYNVKDLAAGLKESGRFGFEEIAYLIGTNDDFIRDNGERKEAGRLRIGNLSATTYSEIGSGRISFE